MSASEDFYGKVFSLCAHLRFAFRPPTNPTRNPFFKSSTHFSRKKSGKMFMQRKATRRGGARNRLPHETGWWREALKRKNFPSLRRASSVEGRQHERIYIRSALIIAWLLLFLSPFPSSFSGVESLAKVAFTLRISLEARHLVESMSPMGALLIAFFPSIFFPSTHTWTRLGLINRSESFSKEGNVDRCLTTAASWKIH